MQNVAYAHPYVRNVSVVNNQITLEVEVTNFKTSGGAVEITGAVTQSAGAVASISAFADMADATPDKDEWFVTVTADTLPPYPFKNDEDVTIFVRVSKVWVTVLGPQTQELTQGSASPTWGGEPKAVTQIGGKAWAPQAASPVTG